MAITKEPLTNIISNVVSGGILYKEQAERIHFILDIFIEQCDLSENRIYYIERVKKNLTYITNPPQGADMKTMISELVASLYEILTWL